MSTPVSIGAPSGFLPAVTPSVTRITVPKIGKFVALAVNNDLDQDVIISENQDMSNSFRVASQSARDGIIIDSGELFVNTAAAAAGLVYLDIAEATQIVVQNRVIAIKALTEDTVSMPKVIRGTRSDVDV